MSHQIRVRLDPSDAPSNGKDKFKSWTSEFTTVAGDSYYNKNQARQDGTLEAYHEFAATFSIQEDIDTITSVLLNDYFPNAEWLVVHEIKTDSEANFVEDDKTYYSNELQNGLRATPRFSRDGLFSLSYKDIHVVSDGSEISSKSGTIEFDKPKSKTTHTVYAGSDGEVNIDTGVPVAEVEVHPGKIVSVDVYEFELETTDWSIHTVRGNSPSYFENPGESFPEPSDQTPVVRQFITDEKRQKIVDARDNGDIQTQLDHVLDILDVIDIEEGGIQTENVVDESEPSLIDLFKRS